ncbi:hypothetical protein RD792_013291 [Penstemon davidsonii]|uniref:Peptidase S8/S53 domain-containing protein n=1 Tax=Penstemon davidsonii TaxID=160366 RepID=A0ABR0CT25_9LAMI|nr:hypothetical protein RD792_013291 [Penstemon davidsonii]
MVEIFLILQQVLMALPQGAKYYHSEGNISAPDFPSPRDIEGHGSHTTSIAVSGLVYGTNMYGLGLGTARGDVVSGRIVVYKICWYDGCSDIDILAAFVDTHEHSTSNSRKPDLTVPGEEIMAACSNTMTGLPKDNRVVPYNIISRLFMSCTHAFGAAVNIRSYIATWSLAALKFALITIAKNSIDQNYPSFALSGPASTFVTRIFHRVVTNVGSSSSTCTAFVVASSGLGI